MMLYVELFFVFRFLLSDCNLSAGVSVYLIILSVGSLILPHHTLPFENLILLISFKSTEAAAYSCFRGAFAAFGLMSE